MMHQKTNATVAFESDVHVLAVDGDPDRIALYDGVLAAVLALDGRPAGPAGLPMIDAL